MVGSLSTGSLSSSSCAEETEWTELRDSDELLRLRTRIEDASLWGLRLSATFVWVPSTITSPRSMALSRWSCRTLFSNLAASSCEMLNVCEPFTSGLPGATGCLLAFKGTAGSGKICLTGSWAKASGCTVYWGGGDLLLPFKPFITTELGTVRDVDKTCRTVLSKGALSVWLVAS